MTDSIDYYEAQRMVEDVKRIVWDIEQRLGDRIVELERRQRESDSDLRNAMSELYERIAGAAE